ncbi:MAG: hypothetical protein FJ202_09905 [Gemmatimonadetes bacterium]|nr:hypothetical protein [Gemmatimonadota bacterium]
MRFVSWPCPYAVPANVAYSLGTQTPPNSITRPCSAQVAKVTGAWVRRSAGVVREITTGDHSEGSDGGQRSRLRAAQRVLAVAVPYQLTL